MNKLAFVLYATKLGNNAKSNIIKINNSLIFLYDTYTYKIYVLHLQVNEYLQLYNIKLPK